MGLRYDLGNTAIEVLINERRLVFVPDDSSYFASAINDTDSVCQSIKSKMVGYTIDSMYHWSQWYYLIAVLNSTTVTNDTLSQLYQQYIR